MVQKRSVTFQSEGLTIAADLHLPEGGRPAAGVVLSGPFTGVKEQVVGTYARRLAELGFVALALDHRNFGDSEGEPRQHENSAGKLADLTDALSFLGTQPEVDAGRLGACGVCLGASYILRLSAFDPRVRAVGLIAGGYLSPGNLRGLVGAEGYRATMRQFSAIRQRQFQTQTIDYMPAVAAEGEAAMQGSEPFEYYGTARSAAANWQNRVTRLSQASLFTLEGASAADFLAPTPVVFVHGRTDLYCPPAAAQATYDRVDGPKDLLWLDTTNHIDLYDREDYVNPAVRRVATFFEQHLQAR
jgi:fermentation-respiration switch protein FrsA (DUF1100 family)